MKNKKLILLVIMFLWGNLGFAQEFKKILPSFTGKVSVAAGAREIDSIFVLAYSPQLLFTKWKVIRIKPDGLGNFKFRLPNYDQPNKIVLHVSHRTGRISDLGSYFVEKEDDISMDVVSDGEGCRASFKGNGSEKYVVADELKKLGMQFSKALGGLPLIDTSSLDKQFSMLDSLLGAYVQQKSDILVDRKIDPQIKKILQYQFADLYAEWDFKLYNAYIRPAFRSTESRSRIRDYFNKRKSSYAYKMDDLMALSPTAIISLSVRERLDMIFNGQIEQIGLQAFYDRIDKRFPSPIKTQMIAWIYLSQLGVALLDVNDQALDQLLARVKDEVTLSLVKKELEMRSRLTKGREVFDGIFSAMNGEKVPLRSLRGKVVLLDIWGTGCSGCAVFHSMFEKEVYPKLKERSDFVVLSVNTDHSREKWMIGINSGKYTSNHHVNVFTDGLTINHPFLKHYDINGFPFLLLIDKHGRIYSKVRNRDGGSVLKLINDALSLE